MKFAFQKHALEPRKYNIADGCF